MGKEATVFAARSEQGAAVTVELRPVGEVEVLWALECR